MAVGNVVTIHDVAMVCGVVTIGDVVTIREVRGNGRKRGSCRDLGNRVNRVNPGNHVNRVNRVNRVNLGNCHNFPRSRPVSSRG